MATEVTCHFQFAMSGKHRDHPNNERKLSRFLPGLQNFSTSKTNMCHNTHPPPPAPLLTWRHLKNEVNQTHTKRTPLGTCQQNSKLVFGSVKNESGAWDLPQDASIYRWPHLFIDGSASIYRWPHLFIDGRIYLWMAASINRWTDIYL